MYPMFLVSAYLASNSRYYLKQNRQGKSLILLYNTKYMTTESSLRSENTPSVKFYGSLCLTLLLCWSTYFGIKILHKYSFLPLYFPRSDIIHFCLSGLSFSPASSPPQNRVQFSLSINSIHGLPLTNLSYVTFS